VVEEPADRADQPLERRPIDQIGPAERVQDPRDRMPGVGIAVVVGQLQIADGCPVLTGPSRFTQIHVAYPSPADGSVLHPQKRRGSWSYGSRVPTAFRSQTPDRGPRPLYNLDPPHAHLPSAQPRHCCDCPERKKRRCPMDSASSRVKCSVETYWTRSKMANIGMYRAMTMPPTIAPMTPIINGSINAVSDSAVDSVSVS
jgi:hypothetical protein